MTVDYLKIDGPFIGATSWRLASTTRWCGRSDIGHVMGKKVVANSVESLEAMEKLKQIGVDFVQGFAIGVPVSMDSIGAW